MRASSTRRRWPPERVPSGWPSTRSGRPEVGGDRAASASAAYPPRGVELAPRGARSGASPSRGSRRRRWPSGSSASRMSREQRVQAAGGQDPVARQRRQVAGARVLRQVADLARGGRPARRRAGPRRRAPWSAWSCRRRCGRPGRSGHPAAIRKVAAASRMRAPARSSSPVAVITADSCFCYGGHVRARHEGPRFWGGGGVRGLRASTSSGAHELRRGRRAWTPRRSKAEAAGCAAVAWPSAAARAASCC